MRKIRLRGYHKERIRPDNSIEVSKVTPNVEDQLSFGHKKIRVRADATPHMELKKLEYCSRCGGKRPDDYFHHLCSKRPHCDGSYIIAGESETNLLRITPIPERGWSKEESDRFADINGRHYRSQVGHVHRAYEERRRIASGLSFEDWRTSTAEYDPISYHFVREYTKLTKDWEDRYFNSRVKPERSEITAFIEAWDRGERNFTWDSSSSKNDGKKSKSRVRQGKDRIRL